MDILYQGISYMAFSLRLFDYCTLLPFYGNIFKLAGFFLNPKAPASLVNEVGLHSQNKKKLD
jgi:hypothetical protein